MKISSNPHIHTNFCDGENTPEEMVKAAIRIGFTALGFTGHSPTPYDPDGFFGIKDIPEYILEVNKLREKYSDQISIHLGLEMDYYFQVPWEDFDYIIGAVHYIKGEGNLYLPVDSRPELLEACIDEVFDGDSMAMVKHYYDLVVKMAEQKPDILAHFDLITKFNKGNYYFDEGSAEYKEIALDALERAAKTGCIFELYSGGVYRGFTEYPYPSEFLLKRLHELKVPIIISSDSHDEKSLDFYFDEMLEILVNVGFKEITLLGKSGFYKKSIA